MTIPMAPSAGDPDKGARLVLEAIRSPQPPFKLILGQDAWEVYQQAGRKAARRDAVMARKEQQYPFLIIRERR